MALPVEIEGTWEEIVTHAGELAGRRVRVIVLPSEPETPSVRDPDPHSQAKSLLKHANTWAGDDLQERLKDVYENRIPAAF